MPGSYSGKLKSRRCTFLTIRMVSHCSNLPKGPLEFCLLKLFFFNPSWVHLQKNFKQQQKARVCGCVAVGLQHGRPEMIYLPLFVKEWKSVFATFEGDLRCSTWTCFCCLSVVMGCLKDQPSCPWKVNTSRSCREACVSNRRSKRVINSDSSWPRQPRSPWLL